MYMGENLPLSKVLTRYSLGLISRKELEGHVFKSILDRPKEFRPFKWSLEEYREFVCAFYPRISRAIDNYRETGASFDAYIASLVRWGIKETRLREADRNIVEYACWEAKALDEAAVHEEEEVYIEPEPVFDKVPNPRQVLVLLLKSYRYMSPDFLERISPALDIEKEKLGDLIDGLRKIRLRREERIRAMQERIYTQFYRCMVVEKKLKCSAPNSPRREKLQSRLSRGRTRLQSMRERLARMKTGASNRQVAEVLEAAKGTIDSHLSNVKGKQEDRFFDDAYEDKDTYEDGGINFSNN
jgi:DNA-binding NarL/FixJ family response regulator